MKQVYIESSQFKSEIIAYCYASRRSMRASCKRTMDDLRKGGIGFTSYKLLRGPFMWTARALSFACKRDGEYGWYSSMIFYNEQDNGKNDQQLVHECSHVIDHQMDSLFSKRRIRFAKRTTKRYRDDVKSEFKAIGIENLFEVIKRCMGEEKAEYSDIIIFPNLRGIVDLTKGKK